MLIIQAMGLERKLKAYKVLLPMSMDSEIQSEFWSFFHISVIMVICVTYLLW